MQDHYGKGKICSYTVGALPLFHNSPSPSSQKKCVSFTRPKFYQDGLVDDTELSKQI